VVSLPSKNKIVEGHTSLMSVLGSTANWRTVKTISCARNSICGLGTPIATKDLFTRGKNIYI
jgi:hypothetical protein